MVLEHCSNCEGSHPAPLDEGCPFPASDQPVPRRVTRQTRRTPSLSPVPPPKRGRGSRQGRRGKTAHQRDQSPAAPDAAQNWPNPQQSPDRPASRDPCLQPSEVPRRLLSKPSQTSCPKCNKPLRLSRKQPPGTGKLIGRKC